MRNDLTPEQIAELDAKVKKEGYGRHLKHLNRLVAEATSMHAAAIAIAGKAKAHNKTLADSVVRDAKEQVVKLQSALDAHIASDVDEVITK